MRREPDIADFLAHLPLFQGLGPAELARVAAGTTRHKVARGEVLFRQGDPVAGLHAVIYGRIALIAIGASGRERLADVIGPGRSFGEAIMFLEKPYIVTAKAVTDSLVVRVAKETVFGELDRNPLLARRIIASLSEKLHAHVRELDTYAPGSGRRRFAAWLVRLTPATTGAATVVLPITKRAVASKLNMSAEYLSRVLGDLAQEGLIEVRGRTIAIADVERLRDWSERQPDDARA